MSCTVIRYMYTLCCVQYYFSILYFVCHSIDSDGVGRTGTFICIHAQLERLKTEGVVDFFQFVKSARTQRPGFILNVVCNYHTVSV